MCDPSFFGPRHMGFQQQADNARNVANARQVAGTHYRSEIQHWDFVHANKLDYFQGQITKYVCRWKHKNGIQDLKKAQHFLEKYIELSENEKRSSPTEDSGEPRAHGYVSQD